MNDELWPSLLALASTAYALHLVIGAIARQVRGDPDIETPPREAGANCVNCGAPAIEPVCGFCGTRH